MTDTYLTNIRYTQMWTNYNATVKVCDLLTDSVLIDTYERVGDYAKVIFRATSDFVGWVYRGHLEEITYALPNNVVNIPRQTNSLQDAAQYILDVDGVKFNLCGELCIASILERDFQVLLDKWKAGDLGLFERLYKYRSQPTSATDLMNILKFYHCGVQSLPDALLEPKTGNTILTTQRLANLIANGWHPIVGVSIETVHGKLRTKGTRHWVAVEAVTGNGVDDGWVDIYNPFSNNVERREWEVFKNSVGVPIGVLVKPML